MTEEINKLIVFRKKEIRRQQHGGEWWFSITDVVAVLTDSIDPARYLRNLRGAGNRESRAFPEAHEGALQGKRL